MLRNNIKLIACVLMGLIAASASAQQAVWSVDMLGFFDNREYAYNKATAQTLFGTRLSPEIGLKLNNSSIMAGASWVQPIDGSTAKAKVHPTVYFRHATERFRMSLGMFPRTQLLEATPDVLQYDSLTYNRPNIAGALFQYIADKGFAELYIDWRQMQTDSKREAFLVAFNGRWQPSKFFFGGARLMMNHLARTSNINDPYSVTDNLVLSPYVGIDLSNCLPLDSLTLKVGYHLALDRVRSRDTWHKPQGILAELLAEWKFIGLRNTFYSGDPQMPFYQEFGAELYQGDPFFQASTYNRTKLYAYLFRNSFVNCAVSLNFHYTPGHFDSQQQLIVRLNIDSFGWKKANFKTSKSKLKGIF